MMKKDMNEFSYGFLISSIGKRNKVTKSSRKEQITSCKVFLEDKTNGLKEEYDIPEGNYSKKEMQKLKNNAIDKLMVLLLSKRKSKQK